MTPRYTFFGLLHVDAATSGSVNLSRRHDAVDTYLRCAVSCHASFARHGESFRIITNDAALVRARLAAQAQTAMEIIEIAFHPVVPPGTRFFAAHFKLDVLEAFARGELGAHVGLVDLDCVLQRPLDLPDALSVYDISAQVFPAYGVDRVRHDLEEVSGTTVDQPRWFGGEFIAGPSRSFGPLVAAIRECLPRYAARIPQLHHVGDEMVVSAALQLAIPRGLAVEDLGASGRIIRWWSARTSHRQPPLQDVVNATMLHLPADKAFLAWNNGRSAGTPRFARDYRRMYRLKRAALLLKAWIDRLRRRPGGLVASL